MHVFCSTEILHFKMKTIDYYDWPTAYSRQNLSSYLSFSFKVVEQDNKIHPATTETYVRVLCYLKKIKSLYISQSVRHLTLLWFSALVK